MTERKRMPRLIVIRHGVTEWSKTGQHTGRTDLPLLDEGVHEAIEFGDRLVGYSDQAVLCLPEIGYILRSPRTRCVQTLECMLGTEEQRKMMGMPNVQVLDDCREWDYGQYEGQTTECIRKSRPGWNVFEHGTPSHETNPDLPGESPEQISERADRVVKLIREWHQTTKKDVVVFTHGHFSNVLIGRFLRLPLSMSKVLVMSATGTAILSYTHHTFDEPVLIGLLSPGFDMQTGSSPVSTKSHEEYQYLELVSSIIRHGEIRKDRTGTGTIANFAPPKTLKFNLTGGKLPLLTTKRVFFRGVLEELLWFISGSTDAKRLSDRDVHIWDGNGSLEFLHKRGLTDRREGDLGPVYGFQWRHFGAKYVNADTDYTGQGVDQLANIIHQIRHNPTDRRILLSAWNPADLDKMALPPCHILCQFFVSLPTEEQKARGQRPRLSCQMYQRSCDLGLGVPFNIASYSLLTHFIAAVTDCEAAEFSLVMGDAHVYLDHVEPLRHQLNREPRDFPTIRFRRTFDCIDDIRPEDVELQAYSPHGKIEMRMSV